MGLCDRYARLMGEFKSFVKMKTATFVRKVRNVAKKISVCRRLRKKTYLREEKLHELLRRHNARRRGHTRPPHRDTAQSHVHVVFLENCFLLLRSEDLEVQRGISQAMVNLLMDSKIKEEQVIQMGFLEPLVDLLQSGDQTVQCYSSECIALLASSEHSSREAIVSSDAVVPLLVLARGFDPKVQLNAVRALFNLTKSESTMTVLCEEGAIPVLTLLLGSTDSEVQFYSCSALSNIASAPGNHVKMLQISDWFLLKSLLSLMGSSVLKNSTQACKCLKNLIGIVDVERQLVGLNCVSPLLTLLKAPDVSSTQTALTLLSKLSAYSSIRESLVNKDVLHVLGKLLITYPSNPTVVTHSAISLTYMWGIVDRKQVVLESECLCGLLLALGVNWDEDETLLSVISCLHSLACYDSLGSRLVEELADVHVARLVKICSETKNSELSFAAASIISKLDMNGKRHEILKPYHRTIVEYLTRFLRNQEVRFQQLAITTVCNLKKGGGLKGVTCVCDLERELSRVQQQTECTSQLLQMLQEDCHSRCAMDKL